MFVTAAGMPAADAAELVRHMADWFRVRDALRRADQLARTGPEAATRRSHPRLTPIRNAALCA